MQGQIVNISLQHVDKLALHGAAAPAYLVETRRDSQTPFRPNAEQLKTHGDMRCVVCRVLLASEDYNAKRENTKIGCRCFHIWERHGKVLLCRLV